LRPALPALLSAQNGEVAAAAARAAAALGIREVAGELAACVQNGQVAPRLRVEALRALAGLADAQLGTAVLAALASSDESLRGAAVRLIPQARLTDAAAQLWRYSSAEASIPIRQSAIAALGDWKDASADDILTTLLEQALAGTLPAALSLDLLEAAGKRSNPAVIERAARLDAARPREDALAPWLETLEGGDAALGRQVFFEDTRVACIRCHKVGGVGGDVGPPLSSVGLNHPRRYLLESIVFPNAVITPGYSQTTLRLLDGRVIAGRIEEETTERVVLLLPDGQRRRIALAEVETRQTTGSAMPEGLAKLLTKRQMRDLIEYLTGLRRPPATGSQF
jgi:quinoprotein glucose dehydrogenase